MGNNVQPSGVPIIVVSNINIIYKEKCNILNDSEPYLEYFMRALWTQKKKKGKDELEMERIKKKTK